MLSPRDPISTLREQNPLNCRCASHFCASIPPLPNPRSPGPAALRVIHLYGNKTHQTNRYPELFPRSSMGTKPIEGRREHPTPPASSHWHWPHIARAVTARAPGGQIRACAHRFPSGVAPWPCQRERPNRSSSCLERIGERGWANSDYPQPTGRKPSECRCKTHWAPELCPLGNRTKPIGRRNEPALKTGTKPIDAFLHAFLSCCSCASFLLRFPSVILLSPLSNPFCSPYVSPGGSQPL